VFLHACNILLLQRVCNRNKTCIGGYSRYQSLRRLQTVRCGLIEKQFRNMRIYLLFSVILLISCSNSKTGMKKRSDKTGIKSVTTEDTKMFKSKVIILLSKELTGDSKEINIQDYVENGVSFFPVFTTMDKFTESTKGVDLGKPKIEIDGILLLSILKGNETLRVNPGLADQQNFRASELISIYRTEIETLKKEMNKFPK
jgi:hypothetical protein